MPKRILVVDDHEGMRGEICRLIRSRGYEVDTASNGQEGLEKLPNGYDGVITDYRMQRMNGIKFAIEARGNGYTGAIILMSSDTEMVDDEAGNLVERPYNDFLEKPFRQKELVDMLKKYMPQ